MSSNPSQYRQSANSGTAGKLFLVPLRNPLPLCEVLAHVRVLKIDVAGAGRYTVEDGVGHQLAFDTQAHRVSVRELRRCPGGGGLPRRRGRDCRSAA